MTESLSAVPPRKTLVHIRDDAGSESSDLIVNPVKLKVNKHSH